MANNHPHSDALDIIEVALKKNLLSPENKERLNALSEMARGVRISAVGTFKESSAPPEVKMPFLFSLRERLNKPPQNGLRVPEGVTFDQLEVALRANPDQLAELEEMEKGGFAPTIFAVDNGYYVFAATLTDKKFKMKLVRVPMQ